ncbi:dextranase-like [Salvia splendens]|uniref:dextranase-like n=1 Tax=Salvia splendens TaxID=180675 RepID=UPI001C26002D|nr:dextranase-like [Salvia splendens]
MLIEQIPTPSSSSSAGADGGDRETSSQDRQENSNPSTPTTAPPQTSTATPRPAVDEETLRRLDKILRSIPSELDDAAAYAELKARLRISGSKDPVSSSKTKIIPSSPMSPSPSTIQPSPPSLPKYTSTVQPSPTFTLPSSPTSPSPTTSLPISPISPSPSSPIQPMQTSEDTSDKEGWGDYGQPFAVPSPGRGGVCTSVHKPHLTEGGEINEEEVEEFHLFFDYGEAEKEEDLPRRQTRRMTTDRLLGEAETLKTRGEEEAVVQRPRTIRQLVDEEESEEPENLEADEERTAEEDSRQKRERKRKGKGSVLPPPKKKCPAFTGDVITNDFAPAFPLSQNEDSDLEEPELRWTRASRRRQGRPATSPSTTYSPQHVVLTSALLQQMLKFDDPKLQEEVHQRVTSQKKLKAGKILHLPSL